MNETLKRRLSEKNLKDWGKPSLVLIDGGKGQLDAAIKARDEMGQSSIPFIGLAKREEQIVVKKPGEQGIGASNVSLNYQVMQKLGGYATDTEDFVLINLPHSTNLVKLLQRVRDESHRFAVSYHSLLKGKRQTASAIDELPGIGPATRKKLIKTFGSLHGINETTEADLIKVVGEAKAKIILSLR